MDRPSAIGRGAGALIARPSAVKVFWSAIKVLSRRRHDPAFVGTADRLTSRRRIAAAACVTRPATSHSSVVRRRARSARGRIYATADVDSPPVAAICTRVQVMAVSTAGPIPKIWSVRSRSSPPALMARWYDRAPVLRHFTRNIRLRRMKTVFVEVDAAARIAGLQPGADPQRVAESRFAAPTAALTSVINTGRVSWHSRR